MELIAITDSSQNVRNRDASSQCAPSHCRLSSTSGIYCCSHFPDEELEAERGLSAGPRSHSLAHCVRQRLNQADNQQHPGSLSSEKAGYGCLLGCSLRDAVVSRRLSPISLWLLVRVTPNLSICNCSSRNPGVHKEGFWGMCWVLTCYNPGIVFSRKFSPNLWPVYFSLALCFYMKGWLTLPLDCTKDS